MTEGRVRQLRLLYANPSGGCNLACRHCWVAPGRQECTFEARPPEEAELSPSGWGSILDEALPLGLRTVKFTGGEPLARIDFPEIWRQAARRVRNLMVETNGTIVPAGLWEAWREAPPSFVSVSMDSADGAVHDSFRGAAGAWTAARSFASSLAEAGIRFQFVMSIEEPDLEGILAMADLSAEAGASSLAVNLVQPMGRGRGRAIDRTPITGLVEFFHLLDRSTGPGVLLNVPPAFLPGRRLLDMMTCPVLDLLGILPDGSISFCGIGFTHHDLVMGNARTQGALAEAWTGSPLLESLRHDLEGPREQPCASCMFLKSCNGNCAMGNFDGSGRFSSPDWICRSAWEAGLFPQGRLVDGQAAAPR